MNLKDTYNKIAEDWYKDHLNDDWWYKGTEIFAKLFNRGSLILDVGCGPGAKAKYLNNKGLKVVGIDISNKLLEIAKRENPHANFFEMDMREADKLKQEFDGIFAQAALLHIPKKETKHVIKILKGKLKKGGYFYIAVKESNDNIDEKVIKENDYGYEYERFFSFYTLDEIKKYFTDLNMKIILTDKKQHNKTVWIQVIAQK